MIMRKFQRLRTHEMQRTRKTYMSIDQSCKNITAEPSIRVGDPIGTPQIFN